MKKKIIFILGIIYFITIVILREYPEKHISSFLIGISCSLTVLFFIYIVNKKQKIKK
ncbi:hypothetical protein BSF41_22610 [Flavobacterium sp. ACN2]|jgi:hypothetical protein|nr:hypothetical protein BSF41_22610 [Flavobacterium sp. ACN2]